MLPFRSNDNGIEWKFVVIDKIMYYTEETIRSFFQENGFYYKNEMWNKNGWNWMAFNESIKKEGESILDII